MKNPTQNNHLRTNTGLKATLAKASGRPSSGCTFDEPAANKPVRLILVDHDIKSFLLHRIELARSLSELGHDVHVALPGEPKSDIASNENFSVHGYYLQRTSIGPFQDLRCFASLFFLYKHLSPALAHHFGLKPSLLGGNAARLAGVPAVVNSLTGLGYIYTTNAVKMRVIRKLVSAGLNHSFAHKKSRITLQSNDNRRTLLMNGVDLAKDAVIVSGSGIDLSLFSPKPEIDGVPVIMMAARLIWEKGVDEFVNAARIIRRRGIKARFLLIGEPDYRHPSAVPLSKIERWQDDGYIEWLGWQTDMPKLLAQCHVFCLPSYYVEGIPRVLLEAAASSRAIVTTDSFGCKNVVRHGYNGFLVPPRDVSALVNAVQHLIKDDKLRAVMGKRGRRIAETRFSLNQVIDENYAVYRSLIT